MPGPMDICFTGVLATASGLAALLSSSRSGKTGRPALCALATAVALALASAGAWLADAEGWVVLSVAGLSGAWFALAAMRLVPLERLACAAAQPAGQAALLLLAGMGLAGWGLVELESNLDDDLLDANVQVVRMAGLREFGPPLGEAATDAGRPVPLFRPGPGAIEGLAHFPEQQYLRRRSLCLRVIQAGPADSGYNCHGWVFTGGKYWVYNTAVPDILRDNGYRAVAQPRPGDLAAFTDKTGTVAHTGLVRGRGTKGAVLLESKWGCLGRYIHTAERHIYVGDTITYYRTARGSHLLSGLPVGASTTAPNGRTSPSEAP